MEGQASPILKRLEQHPVPLLCSALSCGKELGGSRMVLMPFSRTPIAAFFAQHTGCFAPSLGILAAQHLIQLVVSQVPQKIPSPHTKVFLNQFPWDECGVPSQDGTGLFLKFGI